MNKNFRYKKYKKFSYFNYYRIAFCLRLRLDTRFFCKKKSVRNKNINLINKNYYCIKKTILEILILKKYIKVKYIASL